MSAAPFSLYRCSGKVHWTLYIIFEMTVFNTFHLDTCTNLNKVCIILRSFIIFLWHHGFYKFGSIEGAVYSVIKNTMDGRKLSSRQKAEGSRWIMVVRNVARNFLLSQLDDVAEFSLLYFDVNATRTYFKIHRFVSFNCKTLICVAFLMIEGQQMRNRVVFKGYTCIVYFILIYHIVL